MKVVIAGGGTAGHVSPAIALARVLDAEVGFLGTTTGVEATIVPLAGFELDTILVAGFDRSRPLSIVGTGARAVAAVGAARKILKRRKPDVVVGMGGYVSLPACFAARSLRIPIVLHEQNIVLGLAHKVTRRLARSIAVSFEQTLEEAGKRAVYTGNPVAPEFHPASGQERAAARRGFELDENRRTLLVFGGSLGAKRLNDAAVGLGALWADRTDLQVLHVTGRSHHDAIAAAARSVRDGGLIYRTVDYVDGMMPAYAATDLALCRGGATTVAELCVTGTPAVIVPYPHHRDRQQEKHGRVLEAAGAVVVVPDADTATERIADVVTGLLDDPAKLEGMAAAARGAGVPDAAERLASVVTEAAR